MMSVWLWAALSQPRRVPLPLYAFVIGAIAYGLLWDWPIWVWTLFGVSVSYQALLYKVEERR